jgi:hypothetical protein
MEIAFYLENKNDMNDAYIALNANTLYDSICLSIQNVYLTKKFYKKLAKMTVKELYMNYSFTGDHLQKCNMLPSSLEKLVITVPIDFSECAINAICGLKNLRFLHMGGYINITMKELDKILSYCENIDTLYISYPDLDITIPTQPYPNIKHFRSTGFDGEEENPRTIDIAKWFPNLEYLDIYHGEDCNIENIHVLSKLKYLNLQHRSYSNDKIKELSVIYPQLLYANIMGDIKGEMRKSHNEKGSDIFPLKKPDVVFDPYD